MFKKDPLLELSHFSHSPHNIIPKFIESNSVVLDVGCNTGYLGKNLLKKNVVFDGIDINEEALKKAKKFYRKVYRRDLYNPKLDIDSIKYDYIVFSDILEHLPRPDLILQDSRKYLKKDGKIIASIPNIARLEIRISLLLGKFNYSAGILSEDHLRFFTKKSAMGMFEECGYHIEKTIPTGLGYMIKVLPTLTAFQFIYIGVLK